jgi:hypothetical protein
MGDGLDGQTVDSAPPFVVVTKQQQFHLNLTRFREDEEKVITFNPNRHAPPDFWNAIPP